MKTSILLLASAATSVWGFDLAQLAPRQTNWTVGQTVHTSSGPVVGHAGKNDSTVSEYLGIPYAQPPVGNLRFAPPVAFNGTATLNGSSYGFSCPVVPSSTSYSAAGIAAANLTDWATLVLENMSTNGSQSEDCLTLNVWTKPQTGDAQKAVLIWIYGGGFSSGSSDIPAYNGVNIAGSEDVVVVTFNYRLGILGFPGIPGQPGNLGLLDQRLAVEWVRDNIANFGGDPKRITLFGQSAGGASVDLYSYAWASDPIAAGYIPESGTAFSWDLPNSASTAATAWFTAATALGCGNATSDSAAVLACMRAANYSSVLTAHPAANGTASILGFFIPYVDDKVVFSDYQSRTPSSVPMLLGSNDYEGGLFRTEFALVGLEYSDAFWDDFNLQEFTCPAGLRANASYAAKVPVWRYRYFGIWPDTTVSSEARTWHASEIPLIFNTNIPAPAATTAEIAFGNYMRGAWTAFAKDPQQGLIKYDNWPLYNPNQDTLIRLAYNNLTGTNLINPRRYDADCVFVNISSTNSSVAPVLPDLGASITPTGAGSSATKTGSSVAATGTASPSGTGNSTTKSAGHRASSEASYVMGISALLFAVFAFCLV